MHFFLKRKCGKNEEVSKSDKGYLILMRLLHNILRLLLFMRMIVKEKF